MDSKTTSIKLDFVCVYGFLTCILGLLYAYELLSNHRGVGSYAHEDIWQYFCSWEAVRSGDLPGWRRGGSIPLAALMIITGNLLIFKRMTGLFFLKGLIVVFGALTITGTFLSVLISDFTADILFIKAVVLPGLWYMVGAIIVFKGNR